VVEKVSKNETYRIDKIPSFNKDIWNNNTQTNFYNINGLYVNNFSKPVKTSKGYSVSFDVYNHKYMHGAVDVFDENGKWTESVKIKKYAYSSSLYDIL